MVRLLADGQVHSGEQLAERLGVSRGDIRKHVKALEEYGLGVRTVPGHGYCLAEDIEVLDQAGIREHARDSARRLASLELFDLLPSTNDHLLALDPPEPGQARVCLAECQSAGRGRRGRSWIAPFGSGLCLSIGWQFPEHPPQLSALSLAVGVATIRALDGLDVHEVRLKWPNDIVSRGHKLGGILVELRAESGGPAYAVIGIGSNARLPTAAREVIDSLEAQAPIDLAELCEGGAPSRNAVAGGLLEACLEMLAEFSDRGFEPFRAEWQRSDALRGEAVRVLRGKNTSAGIARGIDSAGALLLETAGEVRRFVSGEVSVRRP